MSLETSDSGSSMTRRTAIRTGLGLAGLASLSMCIWSCATDPETPATREMRRRVTEHYDRTTKGVNDVEVNFFIVPRRFLTPDFREVVIKKAVEGLDRHCREGFEQSFEQRARRVLLGEPDNIEDYKRFVTENSVNTEIILELERRGVKIFELQRP